jgi:hypothetical protein
MSPKQRLSYLDHGLSNGIFLKKGVKLSFYRKRQSNIVTYYSMNGDLVYCNNIHELMEEQQIQHTPEEWMLFIASSKVS